MNKIYKYLVTSAMMFTFGTLTSIGQPCNIIDYATVSADSTSVLDAVIEQNISKMEHINSYSAEFVVDYVSPSRDYNEVADTLNSIQEISNDICKDCTTTYDKIKAIHDYVCENMAYDHEASENAADFNTICLKNILVNHRSICAGYSNFFSALCNAQGIYCVNIRGSAVNNKEVTYENLADDDTVTNHEWTAVWYDEESRWIYVDCTWDSNNHYYSQDDIVTNPFKNQYFDISVEELSKNHKAKIVDYRNFLDAINYFDTSTTIDTTYNSSEDTSHTTTTSASATTSTTTQKISTSTENVSSRVKPISKAEDTSNKSIVPTILCGTICLLLAKVFTSKK